MQVYNPFLPISTSFYSLSHLQYYLVGGIYQTNFHPLIFILPGHAKQVGARVYFSDYSQMEDGELQEYIPVAQIAGVRFKNTGQKNYRDFWDPR